MTDRAFFVLAHAEARRRALATVQCAPDGYTVAVKPPKRTDGQNERFHAICGDIAKSGLHWAGKPRTALQWKVLLVSGHATATREGSEMVPGLEGEFVNIRESTAHMSIKRGASLIEYATAFATNNGVRLNDPRLEPA
jgi:hypothetical protein